MRSCRGATNSSLIALHTAQWKQVNVNLLASLIHYGGRWFHITNVKFYVFDIKTKMAEIKITKLGTGIVHHDSLPTNEY